MKKSWGLLEKILSGEKTAESRWYNQKRAPFDKIQKGDFIFFKNSSEHVSLKARVLKVVQFENISERERKEILKKYGKADLGCRQIMPEIEKYTKGKKYCVMVFFNNVKKVKPFEINKKGFGSMSAWITVSNVNEIKV